MPDESGDHPVIKKIHISTIKSSRACKIFLVERILKRNVFTCQKNCDLLKTPSAELLMITMDGDRI
jgi:hypothetical protein